VGKSLTTQERDDTPKDEGAAAAIETVQLSPDELWDATNRYLLESGIPIPSSWH